MLAPLLSSHMYMFIHTHVARAQDSHALGLQGATKCWIGVTNDCFNRFGTHSSERKFTRILGGVVLAMGMQFDRNTPVDWSVEGEIQAGFGDQDPDFEILNDSGCDGMMHQRHYSCTHFLTSFEDARAELKRVGSERASNTQILAESKTNSLIAKRWGGSPTRSIIRGSGVEAIIQAILFGPDTCDVHVIFGY